jgi:hypothetical protein
LRGATVYVLAEGAREALIQILPTAAPYLRIDSEKYIQHMPRALAVSHLRAYIPLPAWWPINLCSLSGSGKYPFLR